MDRTPWPPVRSDVEPDSWNTGPDPADSGFRGAASQTLGRDLEELRVMGFQIGGPGLLARGHAPHSVQDH